MSIQNIKKRTTLQLRWIYRQQQTTVISFSGDHQHFSLS